MKSPIVDLAGAFSKKGSAPAVCIVPGHIKLPYRRSLGSSGGIPVIVDRENADAVLDILVFGRISGTNAASGV